MAPMFVDRRTHEGREDAHDTRCKREERVGHSLSMQNGR